MIASTALKELPDLYARLQRANYTLGPVQWQRVVDLLTGALLENNLGDDPKQWRPLIAPLVCTNREQQSQFATIYTHWLEAQAKSTAEEPGTNDVSTPLRRWLIVVLFSTAMAWCALQGYPQLQTSCQLDDTGGLCKLFGLKKPVVISPVIDIFQPDMPAASQTIKKRPLLQPVGPIDVILVNQTGQEKPIDLWRLILPVWLVALFLAYALWRLLDPQAVLERKKANTDRSDQLPLNVDRYQLFTDTHSSDALRRLHSSEYRQTQRLDATQTVQKSIECGSFVPVTKQRAYVADWVLLIDQHHKRDMVASCAGTIAQRLSQAGVEVSRYYFRETPYPLVDQKTQTPFPVEQLSHRHPDARFLLVSAPSALFDFWLKTPLPWLADLAQQRPVTVINPGASTDQHLADAFHQQGVTLFQLANNSLQQLTVRTGASSWEDECPPSRPEQLEVDPKTKLEQEAADHRKHLGDEGYLLLAALASYPEFNLALAEALEPLLFIDHNGRTRTARLLGLLQLSWAKRGWIPTDTAIALIRELSHDEREQVSQAYRLLLKKEPSEGGNLLLDYSKRAGKGAGSPHHGVFLNLLHGGWRSRFAFQLPRWGLALASASLRRGIVSGVIITVALLTGYFGQWGVQSVAATIVPVIGLSEDTFQIRFHPSQRLIAEALQAQLQKEGAIKVALELAETDLAKGAKIATGSLTVSEADALQQFIQQATWGGAVVREQSPAGTVIELGPYSAGTASLFSDTFTDSAVSPPVADGKAPPLPEMVRIDSGLFLMGSPSDEPERGSDEGPQHKVRVAAFYLSKYEVTFGQYDAFATATGRKLPSDEGWGRGKRPVINVTWEDASAYTQWLSKKTGERYRLPTEAEWEYAARAGTTTPFYTGACITTEQANYDGTYDYNNCGAKTGLFRRQTVEVDALPQAANPWGLYHMAGNVYEWTQDCWHDDYTDAPSDAKAWTEAQGGECGGRVLRGGSWFFRPRGVRSAFRFWFTSIVANFFVGFRVARTL